MLTKYKKGPNFEIGYSRIINNYTNANTETTFYTDKPFANVTAKFLTHFTFKSEYSFYNYQYKNQSLNTYSFWDANLYYQQMKKFRKILKDHQIDLNNKHVTPGFIEKFVNRYVRKKFLRNRINKF